MSRFWKGLLATIILVSLCLLLIPNLSAQVGTLTRRLIGTQDIYFATGGTGAVETYTYVDPSGNTLTLTKPDATHLKFRTSLWGAARSVDSIASRLQYEIWVGDPLYPTFAAAVATLNSAGTHRILRLPPGAHTVSADLTVNSNITLVPDSGAIISISTTKTLTINGKLEAGRQQIFIFTGSGTVAYGNMVPEVYPEWYGGLPDGTTDSTTFLQKALDTHPVLHLGRGIYKITTELYPKASGTIYGEGPGSIIYRSTTTGGSFYGGLCPYNYVTLRNFTLRGSGAAYVAGADGIIVLYDNAGTWESPGGVVARSQTDLTKWRGAYLTLDNVTFENWAANGVEAGPYSVINNVRVQNCLNEGMLIQGDRVQINNPMVLNNAGWGIDLNCSETTVTGGLIYNCGDFAIWATDCGGMVIASHTQTAGANGNKVIGTTIDTSDCFGVLVMAPPGSDYPLIDTTLSGLTIKNVNAANSDVNAGAIAVVDNSTSGTKVDRVNIDTPIINTTTVGHGIQIFGPKNINIDNYHIKSVAGRGIIIYTGTGAWEGINIGKGTIKSFGTDGIWASGGSKLNINGYNISGSSAAGEYYGIYLTNITKFNIGSGIIDLDTTGAKQPYGIFLTGTTGKGTVSGASIANTDTAIYCDATGNYISIGGNELSDTNTVKVALLGTNTFSVLSNNIGGDVVTPAVAASTVEVRNNFTHPVRVTVTGGTVTVIAKGPSTGALATTGATTGSFVLEPKEYIAITYSVAPTWIWAGM